MTTPNPILAEITRGPLIESVHRGAIAIADAKGVIRASLGDIERPVYPRSSLKMLQALPLVESGAADAFGVSDEEVALACASHSGEPRHTGRAAAWLGRLGLGEADLACGAHPALNELTREAMIRAGERPCRLHNNCSGKHTGFLTYARHIGADPRGYEAPDHPVQRAVGDVIAELCAVPRDMPFGIDGCAAPNFALPIANFARALARFADPSGLPVARAAAMRRIAGAMAAHPELVAGSGRASTILMRAGKRRFACKSGAEGYFAAIIPELGLGIALKIDDGATRGAETVMATLLSRLGLIDGEHAAQLLARGPVINTRQTAAGEHRPSAAVETLPL